MFLEIFMEIWCHKYCIRKQLNNCQFLHIKKLILRKRKKYIALIEIYKVNRFNCFLTFKEAIVNDLYIIHFK